MWATVSRGRRGGKGVRFRSSCAPTGPVAENGIYHPTENRDGEVLVPGYLYEVRNIPDFSKGANTMLELVAVVKL
jgi:hypothetical protein